jgi:exo-1,4-beta-D-glucosaminidase
MDEAGLIVYAGFQCCDKWQIGSGSTWLDSDYDTNYQSALAIGRQQRNHPSVSWFSWSDNQPGALQESSALQAFAAADFNVPMIASAEYKTTPALGFSGMKEGPYNWFPPSYAYDILHCATGTGTPNNCTSGSFTNVGGSWAFDSEQSPGHTIPTLDSLNRFMSAADLNALIATPQACQFHSGRGASAGGCPGTGTFGSIGSLAQAIANRYGTWGTSAPPTVNRPSLSDFLRKAHAINYETQRADFEAFIDHSTRVDSPSTGLNYWMMNQGYPSLLWNLFNSDYDEAGSYFGAKKANEPLHVFYAYDSNLGDPGNRTVNVDNLTGSVQTGLAVTANVYDIAGHLLNTQSVSGLSLVSQGVLNNLLTIPNPTLPAGQHTYFVELVMTQNGATVDRNVYWLSTTNDVVANFSGASPTTTTYGDLTDLQTLPKTTITATSRTHPQAGPDGDDTATDVTLTNTSSTLAFMLRVDVRRGGESGDNQVTPVEWSDNYVTLWPGESQTVTAQYASSLLNGHSAVVSIEGWNVDATTIAGTTSAPAPQAEALGVADGAVASAPATPGRSHAVLRRVTTVRATSKVRGRLVTIRLTCTNGPARGTLVLRSRGKVLKRVKFKVARRATIHVRLKHAVKSVKVEVKR